MTKQELLDEMRRLPVHERVGMIANIAMSYVGDDEILGELLKYGDMRIGIVIATGDNAEDIVELCSKWAEKSMGDNPANQMRTYDLREKEQK